MKPPSLTREINRNNAGQSTSTQESFSSEAASSYSDLIGGMFMSYSTSFSQWMKLTTDMTLRGMGVPADSPKLKTSPSQGQTELWKTMKTGWSRAMIDRSIRSQSFDQGAFWDAVRTKLPLSEESCKKVIVALRNRVDVLDVVAKNTDPSKLLGELDAAIDKAISDAIAAR
jgi:hypothetical protein